MIKILQSSLARVTLTLLVFTLDIKSVICVPATSATLLSRPAITMSDGPEDQKSRCPASKQVISCPMAVK